MFQIELPKIPEQLAVITPFAVFYPVEGEFCRCLDSETDVEPDHEDRRGEAQEMLPREIIDNFLDGCMELSRYGDFEVLDSTLISDGALERFSFLVLPASLPVPEACARRIGQWAAGGGRLLLRRGCFIRIMETGEPLTEYARRNRFPVEIVTSYPELEPYREIHRTNGEGISVCRHEDFITVYLPESQKIERITRRELPNPEENGRIRR